MLTYEESAALMNDFNFRGRVKVAALKYADSIMIEDDTVPAHNTRGRWALETFRNPDITAQQLHPAVVMDSAVQAAGAAVEDAALQGAVETVVNKIL
jgi:hypothetical protein